MATVLCNDRQALVLLHPFLDGSLLSIVLPILFVLLSLLIIKFDNTETTTVRNLTLVLPDLAEKSSNITSFGLSLDRIFLFILEYVCRFFFLFVSLSLFLSVSHSLPPYLFTCMHSTCIICLFIYSFSPSLSLLSYRLIMLA